MNQNEAMLPSVEQKTQNTDHKQTSNSHYWIMKWKLYNKQLLSLLKTKIQRVDSWITLKYAWTFF